VQDNLSINCDIPTELADAITVGGNTTIESNGGVCL
jgi:hypothetical protein